jgi:hypothetical protein
MSHRSRHCSRCESVTQVCDTRESSTVCTTCECSLHCALLCRLCPCAKLHVWERTLHVCCVNGLIALHMCVQALHTPCVPPCGTLAGSGTGVHASGGSVVTRQDGRMNGCQCMRPLCTQVLDDPLALCGRSLSLRVGVQPCTCAALPFCQ